MSSKIRSRPHIGGHEHESSWPPMDPARTGEYHAYVDPVTKEVKEGFPPPREIYDTAPIVIFDSMEPQYHEAACRVIDSRKEWERADKETGSITFGSREQSIPKVSEYAEKQKKRADLRKASKKALDVYRSNPREVKQKLQKRREQQMEVAKKSGLDEVIKDAGIKI